MVKRIITAIICVVIFSISLTCCSKQVWTFDLDDEYRYILTSPKGEKYYPWGYNYYISGLQQGKLLGKEDFDDVEEPEFDSKEERKEYLLRLEMRSRVYSVSAPDDNVVVQYHGISTREKYFPRGLDGRSDCEILFKAGERYDFDYRNTNVSSTAFIPYDDIPGECLFDYKKYVAEHGLFDADAKDIISSILFDKPEEEIYSLESMEEASSIAKDCERIGRLVYYPEDADWFCYDGEVIHAIDGRYYLRIYRITTYDVYPIPDDAIKKLSIGKNRTDH